MNIKIIIDEKVKTEQYIRWDNLIKDQPFLGKICYKQSDGSFPAYSGKCLMCKIANDILIVIKENDGISIFKEIKELYISDYKPVNLTIKVEPMTD